MTGTGDLGGKIGLGGGIDLCMSFEVVLRVLCPVSCSDLSSSDSSSLCSSCSEADESESMPLRTGGLSFRSFWILFLLGLGLVEVLGIVVLGIIVSGVLLLRELGGGNIMMIFSSSVSDSSSSVLWLLRVRLFGLGAGDCTI